MKEIKLTRGKVSLVDDSDFETLNQYKWFAAPDRKKFTPSFCAIRGGGSGNGVPTTYMHRVIMGLQHGDSEIMVDHINHNPLDNRRKNLRICTRSQNLRNGRSHQDSVSRFKGVSWHAKAKKWQVSIYINGKSKFLGLFILEKEAARAYDEEAVIIFEEFANPNF